MSYKVQALEAYKIQIVLKGVSIIYHFVISIHYNKSLCVRALKTHPKRIYVVDSFCVLQMTEKLDYLDKLKNNMGEEMAEMMSEEITKVMDEQRDMEQTYARLITERGELKGISNKHKLHETKQSILVSYTLHYL